MSRLKSIVCLNDIKLRTVQKSSQLKIRNKERVLFVDIRIWDVKKDNSEMEFVASFPIVMYKDLEFGGFIEVNGVVFRMCLYCSEEDTLAVEKVTHFEASPNPITVSLYTCPYCKCVEYDAWELSDDEGESYCGSCSSDLKYKRLRSGKQKSNVLYKVEALKMSPYTKFSSEEYVQNEQ